LRPLELEGTSEAMTWAQIAIDAVLALALAISVVTDLRTRKIKNVVTYPTTLICLGLRAVGGGWGTAASPGVLSGLIGLVIGFALFVIPALINSELMGLGDAKLMAAVGAGVGFPMILPCLIYIALVGGVLAVVVLLWNGALWRTLAGMGLKVAQKIKIASGENARTPGIKVPYGVAIACGTVWGVLWSMWQVKAMAALP
jgi:prepilin peptidase CpaA